MFDTLAIPGSDNDEHVLFSGAVTGRVRQDGNVDVAIDVRPMTTKRVSQAELIATLKNQRQRRGDITPLRKIVVPMFLPRNTTNPASSRRDEMSIMVQVLVR